jgi:hypothetical protein
MLRAYFAVVTITIVQSVWGASFSLPLTKKIPPNWSQDVLLGHRGTGKAFEFSYEVKPIFLPNSHGLTDLRDSGSGTSPSVQRPTLNS